MVKAICWPWRCREQQWQFPDNSESLQRKNLRTLFMKDGNNGNYFLKNTSLHFSSTQRGMEDLLCAFVHSAGNPGEYYTEEK